MKAHLFVFVTLALLVPGAQAQIRESTHLWRINADQFTLESHNSVSGQGAADFRSNMDRDHGNGDGTLTAAEIETWRQANSGTFSRDEPRCFDGFQMLRLDGRGPVRISEIREEAVGAAGATTSQARVDETFFIAFQYPAAATNRPSATLNLSSGDSFWTSAECYLGHSIGNAQDDAAAPGTRYVYRIHPLGGSAFVKESVRPVEAQELWDGEGFLLDSATVGPSGVPHVITFTVANGASSIWQRAMREVGAWAGYAAAGTAGLLGVAVLFTDLGRYKMFKLLFLVPGFTRVEKDDVLEHANREELYNFIKSNPGPSFSDLRRSLELSNGNLVHHLRILEVQEYVRSERDGFRTRFYIRGPKVVATSYLTRIQQQLLDVIGAHPGLTQTELADLVRLPRQSVFYHTKQLASRGKLEIRADGNRRRYWPMAGPAPGTPTAGLGAR